MTKRNTFTFNLQVKMKELKPKVFIGMIEEFLAYAIHKDPVMPLLHLDEALGSLDAALESSHEALVIVLGPDTPETPWENCQFNSENVCEFLKDVSGAVVPCIPSDEAEAPVSSSEIFFSLLHQLAEMGVITL